VSVFIHLAVVGPKSAKSGEISREFDLVTVQGHPRLSILVSIESDFLLVINGNFGLEVCEKDYFCSHSLPFP